MTRTGGIIIVTMRRMLTRSAAGLCMTLMLAPLAGAQQTPPAST
jgi:hypothetical protein